MFNIIINNTHVANSLNNMYQYNFKNGSFEVPENSEIMITSMQIPYSWYNITTRYNNNSFKIYWPTGTAGYTPYTVTIPDGFYSTPSINAYVQQFCLQNKLYIVDSTGNNVYYISLAYNITYYANQLITKVVPISLPAGHTTPSGFAGFPTVARTPYIEILANNGFGKILGFTAGNYGIDKTANYSTNSNIIPKGSIVNSLVVKCSLVNNGVSNQSDILDAFAISGGSFGENLNFNNSIEKWVSLNSGRYSNFTITILDENFNDINILDSNIIINFLERVKKFKKLEKNKISYKKI
jgi:hypothetical protein